MSKIKEASQFTNGAWSTPTPIGADDANIDITSATTNPTSDTTATSDGLVASDVTVSSGDTDASAWTKFNRFRKRVQNSFGTLAGKTLATAYTTASANSKIYSASVLNNYMTNVIGYSGTTAPSAGTVASQLSSLNSKKLTYITRDTLSDYGISVSGEKVNATIAQIFSAIPTYTTASVRWVMGGLTDRFGTLASEMPPYYGTFVIKKYYENADCVFIPYEMSYRFFGTYTITNNKGFSGWKQIDKIPIWNGTGTYNNSTKHTLTAAYTNFTFLLAIWKGNTDIITQMIPVSYIHSSRLFHVDSFTVGNANPDIQVNFDVWAIGMIKFTSTTQFTLSRNFSTTNYKLELVQIWGL